LDSLEKIFLTPQLRLHEGHGFRGRNVFNAFDPADEADVPDQSFDLRRRNLLQVSNHLDLFLPELKKRSEVQCDKGKR